MYHVDGSRIRKRSIKHFDLEKKEIKLGDNRINEMFNTFVFDSLEDSSLKEYGDYGKRNPPLVFFSKEEALQGLIVILEKRIKDDEDEISWRTDWIKKTQKRLKLLKHN